MIPIILGYGVNGANIFLTEMQNITAILEIHLSLFHKFKTSVLNELLQ